MALKVTHRRSPQALNLISLLAGQTSGDKRVGMGQGCQPAVGKELLGVELIRCFVAIDGELVGEQLRQGPRS
jgi:hypothetical protein